MAGAGTLDKLADLGPMPADVRVHLDAGYDSEVTRDELAARQMTGQIAHKGERAIDASFDLTDAIITAGSLIRRAWTVSR